MQGEAERLQGKIQWRKAWVMGQGSGPGGPGCQRESEIGQDVPTTNLQAPVLEDEGLYPPLGGEAGLSGVLTSLVGETTPMGWAPRRGRGKDDLPSDRERNRFTFPWGWERERYAYQSFEERRRLPTRQGKEGVGYLPTQGGEEAGVAPPDKEKEP